MAIEKTVEVKKKVDDKEVIEKYIVKKPNNELVRRAERHRAKVWNECVMDDIPTKDALRKKLIERGFWSTEQNKKEHEIRKELFELETKLYKGDGKRKTMKISEGRDLAIKIRQKRYELTKHLTDISSFELNSAESLANNARFDFFVAECCFTENGDKVYKDLADYDSRADDEVSYACASALAEMLHGIDSEFEANLPENRWLTQHNLVNKELSLVDKEGHLVDIHGKPISEDGWKINDKGEKVDINGNTRDKDGNYIPEVVYEDDEEVVTSAVPAKAKTKAKTKKESD